MSGAGRDNIESLEAARARKLFPRSIKAIEGDGISRGRDRNAPDLHIIEPHPNSRCAELVGDD